MKALRSLYDHLTGPPPSLIASILRERPAMAIPCHHIEAQAALLHARARAKTTIGAAGGGRASYAVPCPTCTAIHRIEIPNIESTRIRPRCPVPLILAATGAQGRKGAV